MNKKTAIIVTIGVLASATITYLIVQNIKRKKEAEALTKSVNELSAQYKIYN